FRTNYHQAIGGARIARDFIRGPGQRGRASAHPARGDHLPGVSREIFAGFPWQSDFLPTRIGGTPSLEPPAASEEKGQQEYPENRDNDILELRDVIEVGRRIRRLPKQAATGCAVRGVVRRSHEDRWIVRRRPDSHRGSPTADRAFLIVELRNPTVDEECVDIPVSIDPNRRPREDRPRNRGHRLYGLPCSGWVVEEPRVDRLRRAVDILGVRNPQVAVGLVRSG